MLGAWGQKWVAAGAAALMAVGVAACGGGGGAASDGPVTLRYSWWGNDDRAAATEKAVALFEKKYPNIKVETSFSDYPSYFQKLSTGIAGGSSPDVLQMDRAYVAEYAQRGVLADLSKVKEIKLDQFDEKILAANRIDGALYAIPAGQTTSMVVYDPKAWKDAGVAEPRQGWTWDEFFAASQKLSGGKVAGTTDFGWAIDWFEMWLTQRGKRLFTDDGKAAFTAADLQQFWGLTEKFRKAGAATKPQLTSQMDGSMGTSAFVKGAAASEINYDSSLTAYVDSTGEKVVAGPTPTDTGKSGSFVNPSVSVSVSKRSKHPREAALLANFLLNDVEAGKVLDTVRGLPANKQIRSTIAPSLRGVDKAVLDYEESVAANLAASPPPWPQGASTVKREFQTIYDDVIFGRASVSEGAQRVLEMVTSELA